MNKQLEEWRSYFRCNFVNNLLVSAAVLLLEMIEKHCYSERDATSVCNLNEPRNHGNEKMRYFPKSSSN